MKRSASAKGKERADMSMPSESKGAARKTSFEELPKGYMGKMLVYRSGAIKLKLGDALYDVSHVTHSLCTCTCKCILANRLIWLLDT